MIAKYFLLVLAFITTFVILVHSQSPHVSLSSYQYDPNSIPQNEKILQLFLRLASHTAGKLHLLKQKTLEQQLYNLKENEKIAEASQSDLNIKKMIEKFLRLSSASIPSTQNPLSPHLYQPQNPVVQNKFQSSGIESASEEMNTDSTEIPAASGSSLDVQNRMMVDYDKDYKASNPAGQNILNFGPISPRINLGTDSKSPKQNSSNSNNGESSNNQQNYNPNNQQSSNSNNQQTSNDKNSHNSNTNSPGTNQMGQDPGSITTMFNPATLGNVIPKNIVSNISAIGSELAGPVNMAQETFSKFGSFVPQLRALPEIENDTNAPAAENLVEENQTNGHFSQNPTTNGNTYSTPDNMFVTEEASSMDQNETNDTEDVTAKSNLIFDNETTTNNNHFDEVSPNGTKSNLLEENSTETNPLKKEIQRVDKINDKIKGKIEKKEKVVELELPKESLKQNRKNNHGPDDQDMRLKRLTIQVMKVLQDMQNKIDHRDKRKRFESFSNFRIQLPDQRNGCRKYTPEM